MALDPQQEVVIVGAGIAGVAAAYHLSALAGSRRVTIIDPLPPLSLTTAMGTEAYRNWWPDRAMTRWMNRSIDHLEAIDRRSGGSIGLTRPGYLFAGADEGRAQELDARAREAVEWGMGDLRTHADGSSYRPVGAPGAPIDGADRLGASALRAHFPWIGPRARSALHVRRCGFVSVHALGTWLLEQSIAAGTTLRRDRVVDVEVSGGSVAGVRLGSGARLPAASVVAAVGPHLHGFAELLGLDLPVLCELHGKVTLVDDAEVVPTDAPLTFWDEPQRLSWTADEAALLAADPDRQRWLEELPSGAHFRIRGRELQMLWTFEREVYERPEWPPRYDPDLAEVLTRGLEAMVPGLRRYRGRGPSCKVDGGYYCKAADNRPVVGALPISGAYVIGGLSGFGVMGSQTAAELLVAQMSGRVPETLRELAEVADPARLTGGVRLGMGEVDSRSGQL